MNFLFASVAADTDGQNVDVQDRHAFWLAVLPALALVGLSELLDYVIYSEGFHFVFNLAIRVLLAVYGVRGFTSIGNKINRVHYIVALIAAFTPFLNWVLFYFSGGYIGRKIKGIV